MPVSRLVSVFVLLCSSLAFAGEAPVAHEPQLIDVDGTLLVQLGIFLLLVVVLTKLLWRPYLRVRSERVTRVEGYRQDAERMEAEAAQRLARAEAELGQARRESSAERALARSEAHAREQTLIAEAQADAQRTLAAARTRLDATLTVERAKAKVAARELGRQAARQILGREVPT